MTSPTFAQTPNSKDDPGPLSFASEGSDGPVDSLPGPRSLHHHLSDAPLGVGFIAMLERVWSIGEPRLAQR